MAFDQDEQTLSEEEQDQRSAQLESIGLALARIRSDYIQGRQQCGIEDIWREDEEHYNSVDDVNRADMTPWGSKPLGQAGLSAPEDEEGEATTGSTIFLNITAPYCDAASARVGDMLMPVDGDGWDIEETPYPELVPIAQGEMPPEIEQQIDRQFGADQQQAQNQKQAIVDQAKSEIKKAQEKAKKAKKRISDWHIENQFHAETRRMIEHSAQVGSGILKGPYPKKKRQWAYSTEDRALVVKEEITPASKCILHWNLYPDPSCGDSVHDGNGIFERDEISEKKLQDLIGVPGYLEDQINAAIEEGPHKAIAPNDKHSYLIGEYGLEESRNKGMFEIWYYHGRIKREEMIDAGTDTDKLPDGVDHVDAQVTMVNNRVIRAIRNPLDTGEFPYDVMPWKKIPGYPWGVGVARQVRVPQKIINGAGRNMMDNSGRAAGPQVLFKDGLVGPENGVFEIVPWKVWRADKDADLEHLENAFRFVTVDMFQAEMEAIINFALRMAEEVTGMPVIMQGQTNAATPDTLGGMQLQNNNASTVLRRIARLYDDYLTEPHIRRYYAYLLQYGPSDDEKGDFTINAKGSSSLVEREIQNQQIIQIGEIVKDPVFGLDPKKWAKELFASLRLDSSKFEYDDEQWQQIVEQLAQPQQDSSVQVAQIRADAQVATQQMKGEFDQMIESIKAQVKQGEWRHDSVENALDREVKVMLEKMGQEVEAMDLGSQKDINTDNIKARLSETAAKLRTQTRLSLAKEQAREVANPPTEPTGHAPDGEAFER